MQVTLTVKTLVAVAGTCVVIVVGAVVGYFRLDDKADAGVAAQSTLSAMQCDIRQLKNYMLYSVKPDPRYDRCDGPQHYADSEKR